MNVVFAVPANLISSESLAPAIYMNSSNTSQDSECLQLNHLAEVVTDTRISKPVEPIIYIENSSISSEGYIFSTKTYIQQELPARAKYSVRTGDVLVSSFVSGSLSTAIVPPSLDGALCSSALIVLRPKLISSFSLWCYLRTDNAAQWVAIMAPGATILRDLLKQMPVPKYALSQKQPDGVMSVLDKLVVSEGDSDEYCIDLSDFWGIVLDEYSYFGSTFTVPYDSIGEEINLDPSYYRLQFCNPLMETKFPLLSLGEIAEALVGTPTTSTTHNELVPVLRPKNVRDGVIDLGELSFLGLRRPPVTIDEGDVVIILAGSQAGQAAVVPREATHLVVDNNLARLRVKNLDCNPAYLAVYLNSDLGQLFVKSLIVAGTTPSLPLSSLTTLKIPVPPAAEQKKVVQAFARDYTHEEKMRLERQLTSWELSFARGVNDEKTRY